MKIRLKKRRVIALRKGDKLVRYDDSSEPFQVEDSIGKSLIASHSAELVEGTEDEKNLSVQDYQSMKVDELRKLAEEKGMDSSGKKEELIARMAGGTNDI